MVVMVDLKPATATSFRILCPKGNINRRPDTLFGSQCFLGGLCDLLNHSTVHNAGKCEIGNILGTIGATRRPFSSFTFGTGYMYDCDAVVSLRLLRRSLF